jgi:hypothetical protein
MHHCIERFASSRVLVVFMVREPIFIVDEIWQLSIATTNVEKRCTAECGPMQEPLTESLPPVIGSLNSLAKIEEITCCTF